MIKITAIILLLLAIFALSSKNKRLYKSVRDKRRKIIERLGDADKNGNSKKEIK
jgi:hypothetical protein